MLVENRSYWNPNNGRHYRLELVKDLTDTWVVNRFFGGHRVIDVLPDYYSAVSFFNAEHERRLQRQYQCSP